MVDFNAVIQKLSELLSLFKGIYSNVLVAMIILLVGFIIGKLIGKIIERILHELEINTILKKATNINFSLEHIIAAGTTYFVYFITIIMSLNQLNITTTVLQMVSGAVLVVVIISIILAIKDFIPNVFAGFFIYRNDFIKKGETIVVKGMEGKVIHVDMIETKIETKEGDVVYIPNSALTKTEVIKINDKNRKKPKKKSRKK